MYIEKLVEQLGSSRTAINNSIDALQYALKYDDQTFRNTSLLMDALKTTKVDISIHDKILFTGIGKNETIALKTANMFRSLQYDAHKICPVNAMHGDLGMVADGDVIIALSKSGNTSELIHFLEYLKDHRPNVRTFGIQVGKAPSKFDDVCTHVVKLPYINEANELDAPTNSNIFTQLFFDAIVTSMPLITNEQFKTSHPGGTIGGKD